MRPDKDHKTYSDEELLRLYQQRDENYWLGLLLQRYTLLLLGVAMKYLKDKDEATDAVQQIFLKALTHLPKEEIKNFKGWLYVLLRNHCLQIIRDKHHKLRDEILHNLPANNDCEKEQQNKEYSLEQMKAAMNELSEEQRQTISMFYLQKLSYQQIMDKTGYSFMQVKSFIQNGKRNLKLILIKKLGNRHE